MFKVWFWVSGFRGFGLGFRVFDEDLLELGYILKTDVSGLIYIEDRRLGIAWEIGRHKSRRPC